MTQTEISIRTIQHFLYCRRRWGLLEIDKAWAENAFITKANFVHERVHDAHKSYAAKNKSVFTAVSVYNETPAYGLYGVVDCLEVDGKFDSLRCDERLKNRVCIVEYKPTKPVGRDFNEDDAMQVFAQKVCVDNIFGVSSRAAIYYADVKKRIELPFNTEFEYYNKLLIETLALMRSMLADGKIPPFERGQKCSGCSLSDICLPRSNLPVNVRDYINKTVAEPICENF